MYCRLPGRAACSDKFPLALKDAAALLRTIFSDGAMVDRHSGSLACRNGNYIAHLFKSSMSKFHHLKKQTWVVMEPAGTWPLRQGAHRREVLLSARAVPWWRRLGGLCGAHAAKQKGLKAEPYWRSGAFHLRRDVGEKLCETILPDNERGQEIR